MEAGRQGTVVVVQGRDDSSLDQDSLKGVVG